MEIKQNQEERTRNLEQRLNDLAHISFKDKIKNITYNIRNNAGHFVPITFVLAAGAAIAVPLCYYAAKHDSLTNGYDYAYNLVKSLHGMAEHALKNKLTINMNPDIFETIKESIKQSLPNIYTTEAKGILQDISEHTDLLRQPLDIRATEEYLGVLEKSLRSVSESAKEIVLTLGGLVSLIIDACCLFVAGIQVHDDCSWVSQLNAKKFLKENISKSLPEILLNLKENENADRFHDFVDEYIKRRWVRDIWSDYSNKTNHFFSVMQLLAEKKDKRYCGIFDIIIKDMDRYSTKDKLAEVFDNLDRELEREKEAGEQPTAVMAENGKLIFYEPVKYSELYLQMLSGKWHAADIPRVIRKIVELHGDGNRAFFFELLEESAQKPDLFESCLQFYDCWGGLSDKKKKKIVNYCYKKGSRQFASQLDNCSIHNATILKYIETLDEIDGIGVKGQTKLMIELNNVLRHLSTIGREESGLSELEKIINYKATININESIIPVLKFLERHPDLPKGEILSALTEYYFMTKDKEFESSWIRKEEEKLDEKTEYSGTTLGKGAERKFLEELKRKIELARYDAFREQVESMYYAPLEKMLGEKVQARGIVITDELINVISGYYKIDYKDELQPLLREIVKRYISSPQEAIDYINNLEGNKRLEEKIGTKVMTAWSEGLEKKYDVTMNCNFKNKLEHELKLETADFMRCAEELGYVEEQECAEEQQSAKGQEYTEEPMPVNEELKSEAAEAEGGADEDKQKLIRKYESIFKKISSQEIPEEKRYLLFEAKHHLQNIKQKKGMIASGYGKFRYYDCKDPIDSMQMGIVSGSCTRITDGKNAFASVVNAVDSNKKPIYLADETGKKLGRTLAVLTDQGIVTYHRYESIGLDTSDAWVDFFYTYAQKLGLPLIVPQIFADDNLKRALNSRGARKATIKVNLQKAVCSQWYNDGHDGRINITEEGHDFPVDGYILE